MTKEKVVVKVECLSNIVMPSDFVMNTLSSAYEEAIE